MIADDKEENRAAASIAFPSAKIVDSEKHAIEELEANGYTLVLTDLNMERPTSGLYVAQKSLQKKTPVFTVAGDGRSAVARLIAVKPHIGAFAFPDGKANSQTWFGINKALMNPTPGCERYIHSLKLARINAIEVSMPRYIIAELYGADRHSMGERESKHHEMFISGNDSFECEPLFLAGKSGMSIELRVPLARAKRQRQ